MLEMVTEGRMQVPMTVSWYLSDIGRAQGIQDLHTRQSPQKRKVLREHAIAQSVVSSNRIEGLIIDQARIGTVVFGHPSLNGRAEEEVAGYRDALEQSSQGWHEGKHDPWPYIGYLLYIIKQAYGEFEFRVGEIKALKGEKTSLVEAAITSQSGPFTVADIRDACPGVGVK